MTQDLAIRFLKLTQQPTMNRSIDITKFFVILTCWSSLGICCDLCAIYNSVQSSQGESGSINVGASYQFTHYESNVKPFANPTAPGQHVESNVAQFFGNYLYSDRLSFQLNVPLIYRSFRRVSFGRIEEGTERGLGDLSGIAKWRFWQEFNERSTLVFDLFGGVKLPTGSSERLRDELPSQSRLLLKHGGPGGSLVSGDLLSLGTGSVDPLLGASMFAEWDRWFLNGNFQYQYRNSGRFDYRFGNDFQFVFAPGSFLILKDESTLGVGLRLSGEIKESNRLDGNLVADSSETQLFGGVFAQYTVEDKVFFNTSVEFPTLTEDSSEEVVPRYRLQAVFSTRF